MVLGLLPKRPSFRQGGSAGATYQLSVSSPALRALTAVRLWYRAKKKAGSEPPAKSTTGADILQAVYYVLMTATNCVTGNMRTKSIKAA